MTKSTLSHALQNAGAALLLVSVGAACGISNLGSSTEGGGGSDGSGRVDGGTTVTGDGPAEGGGTANGGGSGEGDAGAPPNVADGGGDADGGTPRVNLGSAGTFAILTKGGISTVPTAAIIGNLGVSPAAATYITGFSLVADPTNVFSTSTQVTGKVYAADYAVPSPSNLTTAISDMETAFTEAAGRAPDVIELGAGSIGGLTLAPGVYAWSTAVLVPASITLAGNANDVWIFQIAQTLGMSSATSVILKGGAVSKNVFWQVAGSVDLGTTAHLEGVILTQTSITIGTGASIKGRLLAQTVVNLAAGAVVQAAP